MNEKVVEPTLEQKLAEEKEMLTKKLEDIKSALKALDEKKERLTQEGIAVIGALRTLTKFLPEEKTSL